MAIYSAASRSTLVGASAGSVLFGFRGSTTSRSTVLEIGMFNITAPTTSGALGLARSTALGTGALTSVVGVAHEPAEPATTGQIVTAWATAAPTVAASPFGTIRRFTSPASFGNGVIWTFYGDTGLEVPLGNTATGELVIVNLQATAPGTYDFYFVWRD